MIERRLFFILVLTVFSSIECAKILGVFHMAGTSHYTACSTLMKILAERGHDVTVVAPINEKNPPKNYKQVLLTGVYEEYQKISDEANMFEMSMSNLLTPIIFSFITTSLIEHTFNNTEFQKFIKTDEKFDVVIIEEFESPALKYLAPYFGASLIVFNPMDTNEWVNPYEGNPSSPSYVASSSLTHLSCEMTFFERVHNSIYYLYGNLVRTILLLPMQNKLLHKYFPNAPHLDDFIYNTSLVLLNADASVHEPLPKVPSMVNVGGFHIKKPKPLPEDLQVLLDNAKNGIVYFSLGSNLKSKDMPKDKRDIILRTFSKLKETVIWKFEDESLPGKPDNVVIKKWLPQNDIFAHKNIKLFISHGGIFSTMEAVYHGIPLLVLPVFADQNLNAKRAEMNGYAKSIRFQELDEETFTAYIHEVLENPKYKENVKRRSKIMTDKPIPPAEAVNYWVEYVIRHQGAPHLKVAALKLAWYQYLLLDVIAFIVVLFIVFIYAIKLLFKLVFRKRTNVKHKTN